MSYFRFCRAYGGHANDGDQFLAAFRYTDEADLQAVLGSLGLRQTGRCEIAGEQCFVGANNHRLALIVDGGDGNPYEVSEEDFQRALRLERQLQLLADRVIDPPQDDRNCICPKYYPGYWEALA